MTINLIALYFVFVLCWATAGFFYSRVVRPLLVDRLRFKLFALRDRLRFMAVEGTISADEFQYTYLERFLCRALDSCHWFTWIHFLEFIFVHGADPIPEDIERFNREATDDLRELRDSAICNLSGILVVNSPISSLIFGMLHEIARGLGKAWARGVKIKMALFFQEQPDLVGGVVELQPT